MSDTTNTTTNEFLPMVDVDHDFQLPQTEVEEKEIKVEVEDIVRMLVSKIDTEKITPYAIHTVINGALKILGSDKVIRPQMMYNYDRNGLIVKGTKGIKQYTKVQVTEFATKYIKKHTN